MCRLLFLFVFCAFVTSSGGGEPADAMNAVAERYAHLVLALGQHDPDYVDAFYGPAEWKTQAEKEKKSLDAIGIEAAELSATLAKTPDAATSGDEMLKLRREYLQKQIAALAARVRILKGEKLKFDDESRALYDAVAPTYRQSGSDPDSHFDQIIAQLETENSREGSFVAALRGMAEAVCDSEGKTRYGVSTRDQGMPRPDAGARCASA